MTWIRKLINLLLDLIIWRFMIWLPSTAYPVSSVLLGFASWLCLCFQDNLFEWHFTIRGPADSEFEGGIYHGRIVLPPEYPMKPPSIILLTVS